MSGADLSLAAPFRALIHDTLPSTSDEAKRLADAGAAHGTIVWAKAQTQGRGRLDRQWSSPPGNLYASFLLRPETTPARAAELGFAVSLAVADAVALPGVALKWPNDVLLDGAKVAGILLETRIGLRGLVDWVVVGIGVNVASAPEGTPYPATCLAAAAPQPSPASAGAGQGGGDAVASLLTRLATAFGARYEAWRKAGFAPIRRDWLALARGLGQPIELRAGDGPVTGIFRDLDADGALLLETTSGVRRITAGDVHFPAAPMREAADIPFERSKVS